MPTTIAQTILPSARTSLGYTDRLLNAVDAAIFARMPEGVTTNHPAFNLGHLAIYPEKLLRFLGREDLAIDESAYTTLFGQHVECQDDPNASIYPPMNEILERFRTRHELLLSVLAETDDSVLLKTNPNEGMRDRFPTLGSMLTFMLAGHMMMHLGQISTWRRCMGLGSAM